MTTDFPTASLGSSQAPTDAMEKSPPPQTQKSGHPRLIAFGRLPAIQRAQRGLPRPRTFAFLGFTNYCGWTRDGRFIVKHKTQSTRLTRKLNELRQDAWRRMHDPSGRPAPLVRQRAAGPLRVLRHAAQLAGACRFPAGAATNRAPLSAPAQTTLAPSRVGLVRCGDGSLPPAVSADHSFLGRATHMARMTFGKSRVRASRMLGSVRAKPNGLATRPLHWGSAIWMQHGRNGRRAWQGHKR